LFWPLRKVRIYLVTLRPLLLPPQKWHLWYHHKAQVLLLRYVRQTLSKEQVLIFCFGRYEKSGFIQWYFVRCFLPRNGISNVTTKHKFCCRFNGSKRIDRQQQDRFRGWIGSRNYFNNIVGDNRGSNSNSKEEYLRDVI
jgi:hypothetical protein